MEIRDRQGDAHRQIDQELEAGLGGQDLQVIFKDRDMELKEESLVKRAKVEHSEEYGVQNKREALAENIQQSLVVKNDEGSTDQKEGYLGKNKEELIVKETLSKTQHPGQISELVETSSCVEESEGEGSREEQISRLREAIVAAMGKVGEKVRDTAMGKVGDTIMGKVGSNARVKVGEKAWDIVKTTESIGDQGLQVMIVRPHELHNSMSD